MIKASIVHMLGWIMPEPLLIAPMVTVFPPSVNSMAVSFLIVSVVMMDSAARVPAALCQRAEGSFFHAALDLVHRKLASDDAGGSHENLIL